MITNDHNRRNTDNRINENYQGRNDVIDTEHHRDRESSDRKLSLECSIKEDIHQQKNLGTVKKDVPRRQRSRITREEDMFEGVAYNLNPNANKGQRQRKDGSAPVAKKSPGYSTPWLTKSLFDDGYIWHKYGQKQLVSSNHPTCYFKCAERGCPAKRHVTYDEMTQQVRNVYVGKHNHDSFGTVSCAVASKDEFLLRVLRGQMYVVEQSDTHEQICIDGFCSPVLNNSLKQLMRGYNPDNVLSSELTGCVPKSKRDVCIYIISESVDPFNDSLSWNKYGQKKVSKSYDLIWKTYLKCRTKGCQCTKVVEICRHNPNPSAYPKIITNGTDICYIESFANNKNLLSLEYQNVRFRDSSNSNISINRNESIGSDNNNNNNNSNNDNNNPNRNENHSNDDQKIKHRDSTNKEDNTQNINHIDGNTNNTAEIISASIPDLNSVKTPSNLIEPEGERNEEKSRLALAKDKITTHVTQNLQDCSVPGGRILGSVGSLTSETFRVDPIYCVHYKGFHSHPVAGNGN